MFATADDVKTKLLRDLTDQETDAASLAIDLVAGLIVEAAGKDRDWGQQLVDDDKVPAFFKTLCIERATSAIANPRGLAAMSEQLGALQISETYPRSLDMGLLLSEDEQRRVRLVVRKVASGSASVGSVLDKVYGLCADTLVINAPEPDDE